jgi:hypothetical protein
MDQTKQSVIEKIRILFKSEHILWGIGASMMLYFRGIVDRFSDIDLFVEKKDVGKADAILSLLGVKSPRMPSPLYGTEIFLEYVIDGVEIDLMCNFSIHNHGTIYRYAFNKDSISRWEKTGKSELPLCALEDWYFLYQMMPGREERVLAIEKHFQTEGFDASRLEKALHPGLPPQILDRYKKLAKTRASESGQGK